MLLDRLLQFFTSVRLTVVCLALGMVVVLWGTLAQVEVGLFRAQNEYFRSYFIFWSPPGAGWRIPVFPGGYLVGGVLLLNLIASGFTRFSFSLNKMGIGMVHLGLILLLVGQLLTDLLARESSLHLRASETKNYSEADRQIELAIVDTTDPAFDNVVAIPQTILMRKSEIASDALPFKVRVVHFYQNCLVEERAADSTNAPAATHGVGARAVLRPLPHVTEMDRRDVPGAILELVERERSLGTWLVSEYIERPQSVTVGNRTYEISFRLRRFYKPFALTLLEFKHDVYPGTQIPKNFSSRVVLNRADTGERREALIYMNNPLRYGGETFYQSGFDRDNQGTILQVVRNPSWLTPYFSCVLVGLGLIVHFVTHLLGFTLKRRTA